MNSQKQNPEPWIMGLDLGSVSVNFVLLDQEGNVEQERYIRHRGQPVETVTQIIQDLKRNGFLFQVTAVGVTGSGGPLVASALSATSVNEIVSHCRAASRFHHLRPNQC